MKNTSMERIDKKNKNHKQNIPHTRFNFDGSWNIKPIKSFADIVGGGTPSTESKEYWGGDINWFTPTEVGQTKYVSESQRKITKEGLKKSSAKLLPKNTILLTTRATIGRVSITNDDATTNQGFQSVICKDIDLNFMYYLLQTLKKTLIRKSVGSTFLEISKKEIENIKVNVPSLAEQKKIGGFLSLIDQKIELMEKKYQYFKKFKKYLLHNIFSLNLRFSNFNDKWKVDKIGKYCEVFGRIGFRGYTVEDLVSEGDGALTIGGKHIDSDFKLNLSNPEYLSWEKYEESPEIQVFNGDVLLVKTASVGKVCFIEKLDKKATINPQLVVFKNIKINNKYFYYYLTSEFFQKDLYRIKSTTGIPTITQKELLGLNIIIPSITEQDKIVTMMFDVDKKINHLKKEIELNKEFKRSLLSKMFC